MSDYLDALFSKLIITRDKCCRRCGSHHILDCAHIIRRRHQATRLDERNAITLCRVCHTYFGAREGEWIEWIKNEIGGKEYEDLKALSRHGQKLRKDERPRKAFELRQRIKELEEEHAWT